MHTLATCSFLNNIGEQPQSIDSPVQLKLIKFLGLKNYMIDNFIFRRKPSKYIIRKKDNKNCLFTQVQYQPPIGYHVQIKILQTSSNSVPVLHLIPIQKINNSVIVYAHGNGSDMADSIGFVQRLSQFIKAQYVVFDYSGYGESRVPDVGQDVICKDLEIVLAWLTEKNKISDIILWGFSLGTFPVVYAAARHPVAAVILQCPIASISCLFHNQLHPDMKFKQDHFANINYINDIQSRMMIMHSSADQIIPFSHAKLLYTKFMMKHGQEQIDFVEVSKIRHNSLHKYIVSQIQNDLQKQVLTFLIDVIYRNMRNLQINSQPSTELKSDRSTSKTETQQLTHENKLKSLKSAQIGRKSKSISVSYENKLIESQQILKKLRMQIVQADIEDISGDMHQLVVNQNQKQSQKQVKSMKNIKQRLLDEKIRKNCTFFNKEKKN